jgi:hypothetical protein
MEPFAALTNGTCGGPTPGDAPWPRRRSRRDHRRPDTTGLAHLQWERRSQLGGVLRSPRQPSDNPVYRGVVSPARYGPRP